MFTYIFYSIGNGVHESTDDVAIVWAWTLKQAKERLNKACRLEGYDTYQLYRLRRWRKGSDHKTRWISAY